MGAKPRPRRYHPSALSGTVIRRPQPRIQIDRGLAWYCLWTAPRAEAEVAKALREAGLGVYVPLEALSVAHRGKLVEVERPVLGRYAFVGLDAARPQWHVAHEALDGTFGWTYGVRVLARVLRSGSGNPIRIPAGALQTFADGLERLPDARAGQFCTGQPVKAVGGPLEGILGAFHDSDEARVWALFNLFGRKTLVEFRPGQLRAA